MQIALTMIGTESWFGGNIHGVLDLIQIADAMGIDAVSLPEHVCMGADLSGYPYGAPMFSADSDFYEPMVMLAALAGRTHRIRLATGVLLLPLRPAVLVAKQVATLDVISAGRVELGVGVGWQKAEYDFEGLPWRGRFGRMMETIEACRRLWSECPASYHGEYVNFDRAYSKPFPLQAGGPPVLLGVRASEINIERLATVADGWSPVGISEEVLLASMARIRARLVDNGRDPNAFHLKLNLSPVKIDGRTDVDLTLSKMARLAALGCTQVNVNPSYYCSGPREYENFLRKIITVRDGLSSHWPAAVTHSP